MSSAYETQLQHFCWYYWENTSSFSAIVTQQIEPYLTDKPEVFPRLSSLPLRRAFLRMKSIGRNTEQRAEERLFTHIPLKHLDSVFPELATWKFGLCEITNLIFFTYGIVSWFSFTCRQNKLNIKTWLYKLAKIGKAMWFAPGSLGANLGSFGRIQTSILPIQSSFHFMPFLFRRRLLYPVTGG